MEAIKFLTTILSDVMNIYGDPRAPFAADRLRGWPQVEYAAESLGNFKLMLESLERHHFNYVAHAGVDHEYYPYVTVFRQFAHNVAN